MTKSPVLLISPIRCCSQEGDEKTADTRRRIEEDRKGGTRILEATKNADGGKIGLCRYFGGRIPTSTGKRRGFEFAPDSPGDADARGGEEIVDVAATSKVGCQLLFYLMHELCGVMSFIAFPNCFLCLSLRGFVETWNERLSGRDREDRMIFPR